MGKKVGTAVGVDVGGVLGRAVGKKVGTAVGFDAGGVVGISVGICVGFDVSIVKEGAFDGDRDGIEVG